MMYSNSELVHRVNASCVNIDSCIRVSLEFDLKIMNELISIKSCILSNDDGELSQRSSIAFNGKCLFSFDSFGEGFAGHSHMDFRVSSTIDDLFVFNCLDQHTKSIMKGSLSLV